MKESLLMSFDGTWNGPDDETNVSIIHELAAKDARQTTYYDAGVGTHWYDHLIGGITGRGVVVNIKEAYVWLCRHYTPGMRVYFCGFSRGAETARALAGFVYAMGLVVPHVRESTVDDLFECYCHGERSDQKDIKDRQRICPITALALFDTVTALGIPLKLFSGFNAQFTFHDTRINRDVAAVYHALAENEDRRAFSPTLFDMTPYPGQILVTATFPGSHSDIGGGYRERYHSDLTLQWMVKNLRSVGAHINDSQYHYQSDLSQPIHDSHCFLYGKRVPRLLPVGIFDGVYDQCARYRGAIRLGDF